MTKTSTVTVEFTIAFRIGQETRRISLRTSSKYRLTRLKIFRSFFWSFIAEFGRPGGIRTPNIRFWRPALYQLELLACTVQQSVRTTWFPCEGCACDRNGKTC